MNSLRETEPLRTVQNEKIKKYYWAGTCFVILTSLITASRVYITAIYPS